ncbi:hypothetical protein V8F06_011790 [Rhypophila decipiens]
MWPASKVEWKINSDQSSKEMRDFREDPEKKTSKSKCWIRLEAFFRGTQPCLQCRQAVGLIGPTATTSQIGLLVCERRRRKLRKETCKPHSPAKQITCRLIKRGKKAAASVVWFEVVPCHRTNQTSYWRLFGDAAATTKPRDLETPSALIPSPTRFCMSALGKWEGAGPPNVTIPFFSNMVSSMGRVQDSKTFHHLALTRMDTLFGYFCEGPVNNQAFGESIGPRAIQGQTIVETARARAPTTTRDEDGRRIDHDFAVFLISCLPACLIRFLFGHFSSPSFSQIRAILGRRSEGNYEYQ